MAVDHITGEKENYENFPVGLRVLAVDDNPICLKLLESLLRKCEYHVTTTDQARVALEMLRKNKDRFDLVISDVHMPDMDGFKLLELVGLEMDLPVIMLSANDDPKSVMKGVTHGACDYLVKPVRIHELKNIWQHVLRRKRFDAKNQSKSIDHGKAHRGASAEGHGSPLAGNTDQNVKFNRKRKDEDDESEDNGNESDDPATQKKPRVVWCIELHSKFVAAVNSLGIEKAVPKRILDLMNVDGLTRENVASHLQKYRLYLKRISSVQSQHANMVAALGIKDSPFTRMGSLDDLGDFRGRLGNVALSPFTTGGMLSRLNSPTANVNIRNFTASSLVQPSQSQNLSSSISALGKVHHPLLSGPSPNPNLFQGIPSGLEVDQLQPNKGTTGISHFNAVDDSRMFTNFTDPGSAIGSSSNLLNRTTNNAMMVSAQSFNAGLSGSSNLLDPGKFNENWQSTIETLNMYSSSLLSNEPFQTQLPRENNSSNGPYLQNPFEDSREGLIGDIHNLNRASQSWGGERQNYPHGSTNGFGSLNQNLEMFSNGRLREGATTLVQQNENENLPTEPRARSDGGFLLEQSRLEGGFVPQSCESLDELVNAMIKREHDEPMPNYDFGFDDFSFGSSV